MPPRERAVDRGTRRANQLRRTLGAELRDARRAAGLTQGAVAQAVGVSRAAVAKVERGEITGVSVLRLSCMASVLGLEISMRAHPIGSPLRDRAHVALLGRLRARLHPSWSWRTEVPLPIIGDLRSWDAMIGRDDTRIGVEAETRAHDFQSLQRRIHLKQRDAGIDLVILLLADTRSNREIARAIPDAMRLGLPTPQRELLHALGIGEVPRAGGLVIL